MVGLKDIEQARENIRDAVRLTPCTKSESLSVQLGCEVYLKLENLQRTGSFKERGALNKLLSLTPEERKRGVVTASAGNHAQGVSYHAGRLGIPATVVMPETSPLIKLNANRAFGARIILRGALLDEAAIEARRVQEAEGLIYVHPFDDDLIIAGQGTIGLELAEQIPGLDTVLVAIGGGGVAAGIATALKAKAPRVQVIGVETKAFGVLEQSLAAHERITVAPATTIADGIAVRTLGERTFPMLDALVHRVVEVDEEEIAQAILALLEQDKTVAEGAGAAPLAGLFRIAGDLKGRRVALVISGGNIDVNLLARIIERGLLKAGRMVKLKINIIDRPGGLARLTQALAEQRANVMEISHNRLTARSSLGEVLVEATLETRGEDHIAELMKALRAQGYAVERVL